MPSPSGVVHEGRVEAVEQPDEADSGANEWGLSW